MLLAALAFLQNYQLPPERFRADRTVEITFAKPELKRELCGARDNDYLVACFVDGVIVLPNPCLYPDQSYANFACHELGHANGWSAKHEE